MEQGGDGRRRDAADRHALESQPARANYLADPAGKRIAWVNENAVKAGHPYSPYLADHKQRTFGTIKAADGTILYYEMITPKLEPGKRYPVFFQHYGGPHSQTVSRAWESPLEQYIVDRGYIFFQIDNRGSANRGTAYRRPDLSCDGRRSRSPTSWPGRNG